MVASKSPRNAAWEGLKHLVQDRVDPDGDPSEIFHWSKTAAGTAGSSRDDRATALVATSVVEQALEHALMLRFCRSKAELRDQLFDGEGAPLRDLSAKTRLAYALGIIGKETRSDISAIRRIRNTFAHSRLKIDFDTPEIVTACQQISFSERWNAMMSEEVERSARERFSKSCYELAVWLFTIDVDLGGEDQIKAEDFRGLLRS